MALLKYMSLVTTFSVFAALISVVWQAFLSLKQLNKLTLILTNLLAIESQLKRPANEPKLKVALGYGACSDLVISGTEFLNYSNAAITPAILNQEFTVDEVNDENELLQTFGYYFGNGAAAERVMPNSYLFRKLIQIAKKQHKDNIQWLIGGNAPLMGIRFDNEGWDVLLGARMSKKLRRLIPSTIKIAGDEIEDDDIHLILEYKAGENWGPFTAPRANRYILHNDQNNPHLNSLEHLQKAIKQYQPDLFVISGIQMMDSYKFEVGIREERLLKVNKQINELAALIHFEMASYVEIELLQQLRKYILPYVDSLGMNEQELENLAQVMEFGKTRFATDSNPRVGATLDQMRKVFSLLATDYYQNASTAIKTKRRMVTRIHLHTLAFQALLTVKNSAWKNNRIGAAKAALVAHRYVCQTQMINPEGASLILDDSFSTSLDSEKAQRISLDPQNAVPCWSESLQILPHKTVDIELCVAPVLVCRVAKKTAGAGDNISAAGLSQQL